MKLQLGLLYQDQRCATAADLRLLLGPWATRAAETAGEVLAGPLALAYRGDQITPEDAVDVQPLRAGPDLLTWDGRLDNREDLVRRLGLPRAHAMPDAALVLAAYQRFGDAVLGELVGEFALALYSTVTRRLCLARSTCGARPLYYTAQPDRLVWASDFAHLVRVSGVALTLNEAYLLGYLVFQPEPVHTPLRHVQAVPPNQALWFEDGRLVRAVALWDPSRVGDITYRSDAEYEAHCRELLTEAVRVRLRAQHPVFAELSGGFDSSTVVLLADQIRRARNEPPAGLQTLSCVYERSETCDERAFIRAIEQRRGVTTQCVSEREQQITLGLAEAPSFTGLPNPLHCFPGRYPAFAARMRAHGARVLLTGMGGDHLFWSYSDGAPVIADALWHGALRRAHQACQDWSRVGGTPYPRLLLTRALPALLAARYPGAWPQLRAPAPVWLGRRHRPQYHALLREVSPWATRRGPPGRRARLVMLETLFRGTGAGHYSEYAALYVSHPYTHRPLVEFCLGIPLTQLLLEGQTRSLMRRALRGVLPERTARRMSKGELDEALMRAVHREWAPGSDVGAWELCQRGLVEPRALAQTLQQLRLGLRQGTDQFQGGALSGVFTLERWLRALRTVRTVQPARAAATA